ncbi:hypothetical protein AAC387_Pa10g0302 [Persea americana]
MAKKSIGATGFLTEIAFAPSRIVWGGPSPKSVPLEEKGSSSLLEDQDSRLPSTQPLRTASLGPQQVGISIKGYLRPAPTTPILLPNSNDAQRQAPFISLSAVMPQTLTPPHLTATAPHRPLLAVCQPLLHLSLRLPQRFLLLSSFLATVSRPPQRLIVGQSFSPRGLPLILRTEITFPPPR